MLIEDFNKHEFHQLIKEIKDIRSNNDVFKRADALELSVIVDAIINLEIDISKINAFLININDLNNISNSLRQILNYLAQLNINSNLQYILDHVRTLLLNITKIISIYPTQTKKNIISDFNKITATYKQDTNDFKLNLQKELNEYKNDLKQTLDESNKNKDYLNSLVGDIKDFSSKYTTKEKAKYYSEISLVSEKRAAIFFKYTNIAMFCALGFIILPILLPVFSNIIRGSWQEIFPADLLDLSFGGALLRISVSFLSLLPAFFFSRIEKVYRERAFKFKDLSNAILSINPYLADIEQNQYGRYDDKDIFKIEMAKIFFTQIYSHNNQNEKDLLKKLEQIANIVKAIKQ